MMSSNPTPCSLYCLQSRTRPLALTSYTHYGVTWKMAFR